MCDAHNEDAVQQLRVLKNRESKAFAVMCKNIKAVKKYTEISYEEEKELTQGCKWTLSQLKYAIDPSIVKETADTEPRIESPNIVGRNVYIQANGLGKPVGEVVIDLRPDEVNLTDEQKLALLTAEKDDITYIKDDQGKVVELRISVKEDFDVNAQSLEILSSEGVYLGSEEDINIDKKEDILSFIQHNLENDIYQEIRNKIFEYTVFQPDGHATIRQVNAIIEYYKRFEEIPYWWLFFSTKIQRRIRRNYSKLRNLYYQKFKKTRVGK